MTRRKPLCVAPFIGLDWRGNHGNDRSYDGDYKPCCDAQDSGAVSARFRINSASSFAEVFNNPLAVDVRRKLLAGEYHEVCWRCKKLDEAGLKSPPRKYEKILGAAADAIEWDAERGNIGDRLFLLDLRPSNLCNLKCRMCSPSNSSRIATEENDSAYLYDRDRESAPLDHILPLENLKLIKIAGGEPMIQPETRRILKSIARNTELTAVLLTNAAKLDSEIVQILKDIEIRRLHFQISVDGTGETFEYIRAGARWDELNRNIAELAMLQGKSPVTIGVTFVAQLWNVFNWPSFVHWFRELDRRFPNTHDFYPKVHVLRVIQEDLSVGLLTASDRELARAELLAAAEGLQETDFELLVRPLLHFLGEPNRGDLRRFATITSSLERTRGGSLARLDPRFGKYVSPPA